MVNIEDSIRAIVRDELARATPELRGDRLAYSVAELSAAMGISARQLYQHIDRRDITPVYSGTKALIPVEEALRFVRDLPDENYGALR